MKSIDTYYNGNYHRSRLEARWAVFFTELGIKYQYEPEGFRNGSENYLPDFFLPETYLRDKHHGKGVYIEIKPDIFEGSDIPQSKWFDKNLVLFKGTPEINIWDSDIGSGGFQLNPWWDNCMLFWICYRCGVSKIEFWEGSYDCCPECGSGSDHYKLLNAALIATKTRFEHLKNGFNGQN